LASFCHLVIAAAKQALAHFYWGPGHANRKDCAAVILFASERATQVALDAIQLLGGNGYINDFPTGIEALWDSGA
jgi:alkylation response protein AidB-like acyl-CoA dehydrogenase